MSDVGNYSARGCPVLVSAFFAETEPALSEAEGAGILIVWDGHSCPSLLILILIFDLDFDVVETRRRDYRTPNQIRIRVCLQAYRNARQTPAPSSADPHRGKGTTGKGTTSVVP
jgi:hypothetical protein